MSDGRPLRAVLGRSAAWSTLDVAVGRAGQFAQGVIIARILAPEVFGVFAVALVVHTVVVNVSELGVSTALVRDDPAHAARSAPTVTTISLASSAVLATAMAGLAPVLATLLGSADATGSIRVMALMLPLAGLTAVPSAFLRRDFRMRRLFAANLANMVTTGVVAIALARAGFGPLALAWSWVGGQVLTTVVLLSYGPGRWRPGWDGDEARRLLRFGVPLAGAQLLSFSVLNIDYVIVGRLLGAEALGLYMLAFNISGWPLNVFGNVIRSVSLPAFARLRHEGGVTADHFARALRLVASISLPCCLLLGALAGPVIGVIYGPTWSAAAAALVGLSVLGAVRVLLELPNDYLVTLGRTRAVLAAQVPWLVGLVAALVLVVPAHGIGGAGWAQAAVVSGVMAPFYGYLLVRAGVPARTSLRAIGPPLVWAGVAAGVAHAVAGRVAGDLPAAVAGGAAGMGLYLVPFVPALAAWARRRRAATPDPVPADLDELAVAATGELR